MRVERLVWVMGRFAIVGISTWALVACRSKGFSDGATTSHPIEDAGPVPCVVSSAAPPASCNVVVGAVDVGDAGDAGIEDAASPDDAEAPDAAVYESDGSCPIVTTSQITCGDTAPMTGAEIAVAAGDDGAAYATIVTAIGSSTGSSTQYGSQLAELHGDGSGTIDLEPVPKATSLRAVPVVGGDGSPGVVADRSTLDLEYYARTHGAWNAEKIPATLDADSSFFGAASAPDGKIFMLFGTDYTHIALASRAASGGWTTGPSLAASSSYGSTLAVDADGTPYVLGLADSSTSFFLAAGDNPVATFPSSDSSGAELTLAVAGAPGATKQPIALRMENGDPLLDIFPLGNPTSNRVIGGETSSTCSGLTIGIDCSDCQVGSTCDTYAEQVHAYATATTDDGTVWLVYIDDSEDIHGVVDVENDPIFLGCYCTTTTQSTSLVSTALIVTPFGPHGEATGVTMRIPLDPTLGTVKVAAAAKGSTLHVLATGSGAVTHTAIDTSKIPRGPF